MRKATLIISAGLLLAISCGKDTNLPTPTPTPVIHASVTAESSDIRCDSATISGKLAVESKGDFKKSAALYYSSTVSTLDALKADGTKKALTLASNGEFSVVINPLERETKYYFVVVSNVDDAEFVSDVKSFTTLVYPIPELVDLGLSVKWASFNLGASKPREGGAYFQWAGMQDVTSTSIDLNWSNCPYHTGSGWTKYSKSGSTLDLDDDVAHVKLGGNWRMPTVGEWAELVNTSNCTWKWENDGYRVTSNKTGKSIFLPVTGYRYEKYTDGYSGVSGWYWASKLQYPDYGMCLYFRNDQGRIQADYYQYRYYGLIIRPVCPVSE